MRVGTMCSDMPANEVKEREQEDPYDVDEMPVQTADLDRRVVLGGDRAAPRQPQHDGHDAKPGDHVQRVKAGHQVVEREEDLRVLKIFRLESEAGARQMALDVSRVVLERLD